MVADVPGQPGLSSASRPPRGEHTAWYGRWLQVLLEQITDSIGVVLNTIDRWRGTSRYAQTALVMAEK